MHTVRRAATARATGEGHTHPSFSLYPGTRVERVNGPVGEPEIPYKNLLLTHLSSVLRVPSGSW